MDYNKLNSSYSICKSYASDGQTKSKSTVEYKTDWKPTRAGLPDNYFNIAQSNKKYTVIDCLFRVNESLLIFNIHMSVRLFYIININ